MARSIHIIGAGLAGLAAAIRLADSGAHVVVHEATAQPGGRCRSYRDQATGMMLDNGNHLVLSGNRSVLEFAQTIGSAAGLVGPPAAEFPFVDLASGQRWTLRINDGVLPWWIFSKQRRVPGTRAGDYLRLLSLMRSGADRPIGAVLDCTGPLYDRLIQPLLLAALNIEPRDGSSALAEAIVRETLGSGGKACRPLVAREGLGPVFIEPALRYLGERNVAVRLGHELRALRFADDRVTELDFGSETVALGVDDAIVLAVPAYATAALVPQSPTPTEYRAIVNAHFRVEAPAGTPPIVGVLNATTEWIFAFPGRLSVTISNADRFIDMPRKALAQTIWNEVAAATGATTELPSWQIVRERRATFAATPAENAKRPNAATKWHNLVLAGDWTATGLPATLEGAVRSGYRAAELIDRMPAGIA